MSVADRNGGASYRWTILATSPVPVIAMGFSGDRSLLNDILDDLLINIAGQPCLFRSVDLERLGDVLDNAASGMPDDEVIWASVSPDDETGVGTGDAVLLAYLDDGLARSWLHLPRGTRSADMELLSSVFPTCLVQDDGTFWLSHLPEHDGRIGPDNDEDRFGYVLLPGDALDAVALILVLGMEIEVVDAMARSALRRCKTRTWSVDPDTETKLNRWLSADCLDEAE